MARSQKGTRKISVKNRDYRWYLSKNAGTLFVFPQRRGRCMMSMKLPWVKLSGAYKIDERSKVPVTPKDVRHAILHALNCGWDPDSKDHYFAVPSIVPKYEELISFVKERYYQEVLDEGFRSPSK